MYGVNEGKKTYQWQRNATHDRRGEETHGGRHEIVGGETMEEPWTTHTMNNTNTSFTEEKEETNERIKNSK